MPGGVTSASCTVSKMTSITPSPHDGTITFEKLRRALYGRRSERSERLLRQLELELDELTASATEDDLRAETGPDRTTGGKGFERHRPSRKPFPEHLSRERVVVPAPTSCTCCGSRRLSKVGEDVTETLEVIPRQWKVIETVREKFTCRDCEKFSQPPAPFHAVPRGWAGPNLLATIVFEKYGQHQPLNRQSERYAREGVELSISTLTDQVGACAVALRCTSSLRRMCWQRNVCTVTTRRCRCWPRARPTPRGPGPMCATTHRSPIRTRRRRCSDTRATARAHTRLNICAASQGIFQADAHAGFNPLYAPGRVPGPVSEASCWAHGRRKFYELADIAASKRRGKSATPIAPLTLEAVKRIFEHARKQRRAALGRAVALGRSLDAQNPNTGTRRRCRNRGRPHRRCRRPKPTP